MFKGLGDIANLMKNAGSISARTEEMQERLKSVRVEGTSGGGMVKVEATGDHKILNISIEDSLMQAGDKEMLEDLILSATNQALEHARQATASEMAKLAEGIGIPGMGDAMSKFGFGS